MLPPFTIRPAQPIDTPAVFALIQALAEYEQLTHQVVGNADLLEQHLFGPKPSVEAIVATVSAKVDQPDQSLDQLPDQPPNQLIVGFALFFPNYSTFLTQPGIYLEDLFVLPTYRSQGIGKALIKTVAQIAHDRGCGRMEWSVLDWNAPAIAFYQSLGADILPDWRTCRVTGTALMRLADPS
jgi:GNAT superfamily N-acetyltransferase